MSTRRRLAVLVSITLVLAGLLPATAFATVPGVFDIDAQGRGDYVLLRGGMYGWKRSTTLSFEIDIYRDGVFERTIGEQCSADSGCTSLEIPERQLPCDHPGEVWRFDGRAFGPGAPSGGLRSEAVAVCPGQNDLLDPPWDLLDRLLLEKRQEALREADDSRGQVEDQADAVPTGCGGAPMSTPDSQVPELPGLSGTANHPQGKMPSGVACTAEVVRAPGQEISVTGYVLHERESDDCNDADDDPGDGTPRCDYELITAKDAFASDCHYNDGQEATEADATERQLASGVTELSATVPVPGQYAGEAIACFRSKETFNDLVDGAPAEGTTSAPFVVLN